MKPRSCVAFRLAGDWERTSHLRRSSYCLLIIVLSGTCFAQSPIFTPAPDWSSVGLGGTTNRVLFADLDRDGDLDCIGAMHRRGSLFWNRGTSTILEHDTGWVYPPPHSDSGNRGDLVLGDVNGDGLVDIVIGRAQDHRAELVINTPDGLDRGFSWRSSLPHDGFALADFDQDGDLDLICGGADGGPHAVYLNEGPDAGLSPQPVWSSATSSDTRVVALGDLDGDGDLDLVCGNGYLNVVGPNHIFINRGTAEPADRFGLDPDWTFLSGATHDLALGDVDGDGDLDLVVVDYDEARIHLNRWNEGDTWSLAVFDFAATAWRYSGSRVSLESVELGDVDSDGDLDLALGRGPNAASLVFLNRGAPPWFDAVEFALPDSGKSATDIALVDVDGDGDLDLMAAYATVANAYELFLNKSPRVSPVADTFMYQPLNSHGLAAGDVDGDGDQDIVVGGDPTSYLYRATPGGELPFPPVGESINQFDATVRAVALVDLDADGYPEFVCGTNQENHVYSNLGGSFARSPTWVSLQSSLTTSIACGDVDGNGWPDVLFGNMNARDGLFLNFDGILADSPSWESGEQGAFYATRAVALSDLDRDGDLDAVFGSLNQANRINLNAGTGLAAELAWTSRELARTTCVAVGDVDGDGYPDVVFGNDGQANHLYINAGGNLAEGLNRTPDWRSDEEDSTRSIALADVDGDGDLDIVCGNASGGLACYLNSGGEFPAGSSWRTESATNVRAIVLADFDLDGDLDLACSNGGDINAVHLGRRHPLVRWDTTQPTNHLPNNPTVPSGLRVTGEGSNLYRISLVLRDVESDPVGMIPRYRYAGSPVWYPAQLDRPVAALATSPAGESYDLLWDVSQLPIDPREVILGLVTIPNPQRFSEIRQGASAEYAVGPLQIRRPRLITDPVVSFGRVTWGDTVSTRYSITNIGNAPLDVAAVALPLPVDVMWFSQGPPFALEPGATVVDTVFLAPEREHTINGTVVIQSNDPLAPSMNIAIEALISSLIVETMPLLEGDMTPLGQALTIQTIPPDTVRVERAALWYRGRGSGTFTSIEMTPSGRSFIGIVPGPEVTEEGLEYFVEVENSGVFATDPADTSGGRFFTLEVAAPTAITVLPLPTSGDDYLAGREITVQVSLVDGVVYESGVLHYRRGGENGYAVAPVEAAGPVPVAVIPDSVVGPRGVEYWVEVTTSTAELTDPPTDPAGNPHTLRVRVADLVEPGSHAGYQYRMVSVPLDFGADFSGTLESLLSDQAAFGPYPGEPYDLGQWRCFRGLPPDGAPRELPTGPAEGFHVVPGRGFWLISRSDHQIATSPVSGTSTATNGPFSITLVPGWNMVGHPFAFPVAWNAVTVDGQPAAAAAVEGPWSFAGASYVDVALQESPRLEPFAGYWIRNSAEPARDVVLRIPPQESPSARQAAQTVGASPRHDILWQLAITAACAGVQDEANRLGVSARARDTWDALDRHEPPAAPERSVSLAFPHSSWLEQAGRYTADYRAAATDAGGYTWLFDVAKDFRDDASGNMVEVSFAGLEGVPTEYEVSLLDRELARVQDLRESAVYAFHLGIREPAATESAARFALLVGAAGYVDGQLDDLSTPPLRTALHQNYPNPFNPETVIRWDVAEAGPVDLKIYDLAGALVRTAHAGLAGAGGHEFVWRGDDDHGRRVASGVYIYRLRAGDVVQTKRMMLVK